MVMGSEIEYGIGVADGTPVNPVMLSEGVVTRVEGLGIGHLDRMLGNGARVYVDHAHPEYSGPECASATDVLTWELAGDALLSSAATRLGQALGRPVVLHRNNTDGKGRSYGYHENYLLPRALPWDDVVAQLTGHLVSRVVLVGAGRVGLGQHGEQPGFQTSQRADFMERLEGIETTVRRPLVNTRDEPHADRTRWRRLHVITGDATLAHVATLVKVGATALVCAAIAAGTCRVPRLVDPLAAIRAFSRGLTLTTRQPCTDGVDRSALDLQQLYLEASAPYAGTIADGALVLQHWAGLLDDARRDPHLLADRVDWAAKLALLEGLGRRHGWGLDGPQAQAVDLQWHELDPARGLGLKVAAAGRLQMLVGPAEVRAAMLTPPSGTRAQVRARLLTQHQGRVVRADWAQLGIASDRGIDWVDLPDPWGS
ncbi:proteasome accessory factor PafA2 family protein [Propionibacteriaceae bacterium G57]|uniref:proteasome accessory factor PafA2 family protein n=1 Tax=Aestuariimicrobium sp. G57 TaxID=3418485 RepID=UPI003DA7997A